MRRITCDKCGLPMENKCTVRIDHRIYDICNPCEQELMKGLEGKGEIVPSLLQTNSIKYLQNPNDHKHLCQE